MMMNFENLYFSLYADLAVAAKTYYYSFNYDDWSYPYGVDLRTHAADWNLGLPNFQICFPIDTDIAIEIIESAIELAKAGYDFDKNPVFDGMLENGTVTFVKVEIDESTDKFEGYRIILPGPNGSYGLQTQDINTKHEKISNNNPRNRRSNANTNSKKQRSGRKSRKATSKRNNSNKRPRKK